jgi:mutator protein MutT
MKPISILIPFKVGDCSNLMLWNQVRSSTDELNSLLEFPGGKIEDGESPLDACLREVSEEVGIEISKERVSKYKTLSFSKDTGNLLIINVFLYEDNDSIFPSEGWLKVNEINHKKILPNNIIIIKEFVSYYQQVTTSKRD